MPKLVDHVSYRKYLLDQCVDLFARYGYGALTMRQIAEALHVSTGTLYYYHEPPLSAPGFSYGGEKGVPYLGPEWSTPLPLDNSNGIR